MYTAWSDVGCVHSCPRGALVKLHHLLAFLEKPEEGRQTSNVEDVGADAHDVVQNTGHLTEQHSDVLGPEMEIKLILPFLKKDLFFRKNHLLQNKRRDNK